MNKKTIFKKLLQISLISLLSIQSACVFSTNCYKVGYSQEIDGTFFDEKESKGYFIYSYLDKKDSKSYFLYSIDLNGKAEKLADLGSKPYDSKNPKNTLSYKFHVLPNDKIFLEESNFTGIREHYFYLVDLKNKSIIYKKEAIPTESIFSSDGKNLLMLTGGKISIFNVEKGTYYSNTLTTNEEQSYLNPQWINTNTIVVKNYNKDSISIYELKDNNINKIFEYNIKVGEENLFNEISPQSYTNNVLEFETDVSKIRKSGWKVDLYKVDFSNNLVSLIKKNVRESLIKKDLTKILLKASQKMYLLYVNPFYEKPIFDYLNELPKSFYSAEIVCGDYKTMDKDGSRFIGIGVHEIW